MAFTWMKWLVLGLIVVLIFGGFQFFQRLQNNDSSGDRLHKTVMPDYTHSKYKEIYLAGGCFWGVQAYFDRITGVLYTNVGYANGMGEDTSYRAIGKTGHAETVYIVYDSDRLSLETLLTYYYEIIDPTSIDRQGNDVGVQYRTGIYFVDPSDLAVIEKVTLEVEKKLGQKVATQRETLKNYVLAEDYHQDYLDKNPGGYCHISLADIPNEKPPILEKNYPLPSKEALLERLTKEQYQITQGKGTERAFDNAYWDNKEKGLYVDIVTGEPLFSSEDKYNSGTGWPSFSKPIQWDVVEYLWDNSVGTERVEVISRSGKTHLGHIFRDGPKEEGGLRYCMNSGALQFISFDLLDEEGYGAFKSVF